MVWADIEPVLNRVADEYGERLLRVKGLLALVGQTKPHALHGVNHFFHSADTGQGLAGRGSRSRIVFITDRVPEAVIRPFFAEWLNGEPVGVSAGTEESVAR